MDQVRRGPFCGPFRGPSRPPFLACMRPRRPRRRYGPYAESHVGGDGDAGVVLVGGHVMYPGPLYLRAVGNDAPVPHARLHGLVLGLGLGRSRSFLCRRCMPGRDTARGILCPLPNAPPPLLSLLPPFHLGLIFIRIPASLPGQGGVGRPEQGRRRTIEQKGGGLGQRRRRVEGLVVEVVRRAVGVAIGGGADGRRRAATAAVLHGAASGQRQRQRQRQRSGMGGVSPQVTRPQSAVVGSRDLSPDQRKMVPGKWKPPRQI